MQHCCCSQRRLCECLPYTRGYCKEMNQHRLGYRWWAVSKKWSSMVRNTYMFS
jgi:hypothetical protein